MPGRVDPLEGELAAIFEFSPRRAEDAAHRVGGEDPAGKRDRLDALGDDQRLPMQAAVLAQYLAGVQTDAELNGEIGLIAVAPRDGALDFLRTRNRAPR